MCIRDRRRVHGYLLRCTIGGLDENFIACGSEDNNIYIWHRNSPKPIEVLKSHTSIVNAVHWHPNNPFILISGSDDQKIKSWTTKTIVKTLKPKNQPSSLLRNIKSLFRSILRQEFTEETDPQTQNIEIEPENHSN
eukprot:TRINITY_DN12509_c0_g1_i1.p2 TRINITY_DN12509_c0_g1~~TRINITY_DN12509_c0_g1_i1.p2  ORF type:complete len:136 (-),score=11.22 TRINITY_DN12509_c0_g1_i1:25-432(-)